MKAFCACCLWLLGATLWSAEGKADQGVHWLPAAALEIGYPIGPALALESVVGLENPDLAIEGVFSRTIIGLYGPKADLGFGTKTLYGNSGSYDFSASYYTQYESRFGINNFSDYVGVTLGGNVIVWYGQVCYLHKLRANSDPADLFFVSLGVGL